MNAVTGTDSDDWCVFDGVISVAENNGSVGVGGTNEMRGEGDWERRRPEREGSVDRRLGDGARGESSANVKSVVDSESLGKLRDEEDEQGGGARKCCLLGCKLVESPEQVEGVELVMEVCGETIREERDPAGLGAGDVVDVRFGDGRGNNSFSFWFSFSSSSSSGMRGVGGVLQLGEGEARALAVDELDAAVRRRINGTLHSSLSNHSVSWLVVDGPVSLERRRVSTSSTLIETPRAP